MGYIQPQSDVYIMHNVPFDSNYEYTCYFATPVLRDATLLTQTYTKYQLQEYSYQRVTKNSIRVEGNKEKYFDCNYMAFRNPRTSGNKVFYAFITNMEYVNEETTDLFYEIDVIQTFSGDYTFRECFIERQHVENETIAGQNTLAETVATGDYYLKDLGISETFDEWGVVIAASFDDNYADATGGLYGGVYSGIKYLGFKATDTQGVDEVVNTFLQEVNRQGKINGIVSMFMVPEAMIANEGSNTPLIKNLETIPPSRDWASWQYTYADNTHGPRNRKLYTYPFNTLIVDNGEGETASYKYEDFAILEDSGGNWYIPFVLYGVMSPQPECWLVPSQYKGTQALNFHEKFTINSFPQCAYNNDTFKAWLAQNKARIALTGVQMAATVATAAIAPTALASAEVAAAASASKTALTLEQSSLLHSKDVAGNVQTGQSLMGQVSSLINEGYQASIAPPHIHGNAGSMIGIASKQFGFRFYNAHVKREYCQIIDSYFDKYGYAIKHYGIPNRAARPKWTYIKTKGCTINTNIPTEYERKICSIYDNGITFWRNISEVGSYANPESNMVWSPN